MRKYISLLLISCLSICCKKEAMPAPSAENDNPYMRVDNPSSVADHAIYALYKSSGVPVFYNDTITTSPLLVFTYNLQLDPAAYLKVNHLQDPQDVVNGVNFLEASILPYLGDSLKPFSIMLTDSVYATPAGSRIVQPMTTYAALTGLVIANVANIKNMPADTLSAYRAAILKSIVFAPVAADTKVDTFYAVCADYYNMNVYGDGSIPGYLAYRPKEEYGFLKVNYESSVYYLAPAQADDLDAYLGALLTMSTAAFQAKYGTYPLVMKKYNILVSIVKAAGLKI